MQSARRYDPTQDAKYHVSIATTEAVRQKWATPIENLHRPKPVASAAEATRGLSAAESAPDAPTVSKDFNTTKTGNAPIGLSRVFKMRSMDPFSPAVALLPHVATYRCSASVHARRTRARARPPGG